MVTLIITAATMWLFSALCSGEQHSIVQHSGNTTALAATLTANDIRDTSAPNNQPFQAPEDHHIILISIDGFPAHKLWSNDVNLPTLRVLAEYGVWAQGLRPINPTNTWPNHASLLTGVRSNSHGVLFNGKPTSTFPVRVNAREDAASLVFAPTVFELANAAGYSTAAINWPGTRSKESVDDNLPDTPDPVDSMSEDFMWDLFDAGILSDLNNFAIWQFDQAGRDSLFIDAAQFLIENRMPRLMGIHLLDVDKTMHRIGPDSQEALAALERADRQIERLLEALVMNDKHEQTTIFIVSDHGMSQVDYLIRPNILLRDAGLLEVDDHGQPVAGKAQVLSGGGFAMVYVNDNAVLPQVAQLLSGLEGIELILNENQFEAYGLPSPENHPHTGAIALFALPGYAISNLAEHDDVVTPVSRQPTALGQHGYLNSHTDMLGLFIAAGKFIDQNDEIQEILEMVDVAPTIATLLGLGLPHTDGRVLYEILNLNTAAN